MTGLGLALLLQSSALPDLSGARWHYVGQSEAVAHYVDANSVERDGKLAAALLRMVHFNPAQDRGSNLYRIVAHCERRAYVRTESYRVEGGAVTAEKPDALASVQVPAEYYPMAAAAIDLACDGKPGQAVADPEQDARRRAGGERG